MTPRNPSRLSRPQLDMLLNIARRCLRSGLTPVHANASLATRLWRRGLLHYWSRKSVLQAHSTIGPFWSPTRDGWKLAAKCGVSPPWQLDKQPRLL